VARRAVARAAPRPRGFSRRSAAYDVARASANPSLQSVHDEPPVPARTATTTTAAADGDFDKAIALFRQVPRNSEFFIKAKFFEGVTYCAQVPGQARWSTRSSDILADRRMSGPAQYRADDIDNYRELAQLQMARVFYSTQQFDTSIKYFEKLDRSELARLAGVAVRGVVGVLHEDAQLQGARQHPHAQRAYFENQFFPESVLLKAVIYFKYSASTIRPRSRSPTSTRSTRR